MEAATVDRAAAAAGPHPSVGGDTSETVDTGEAGWRQALRGRDAGIASGPLASNLMLVAEGV